MKKKDIRDLSEEELSNFFLEKELPKFRMSQLNEWLWRKAANSFEEMTSLSKEIRNLLKNTFSINSININQKIKSSDGTIKYSFILHDQNLIEGVLIPSKKRVTACISSQVGCSLDCKFCATGTLKLRRNLTHYEIFLQAYKLNEESKANYGKGITNIVFMGMGEPLLNYKNLLHSIEKITSNEGMGMSPRRITVSTVGISKMIKKLADDNVKFNLAISLHSADNDTRSNIMSINHANDLSSLSNAIKYYFEKTKNRITYEYVLLRNVNDSIDFAKKLAAFSKICPCKINLIEYNPIKESEFNKSTNNMTRKFAEYIESKNIIVTIRRSKGEDINAACGQLVNNLS